MEIEIIFALIILGISILFWMFPSNKTNWFYGYRTKRSMKNPESWRFAQRLSGRLLFMASIILLILTFLNSHFQYGIYPVLTVFIPLAILVVVVVEYKLYKRDRDG